MKNMIDLRDLSMKAMRMVLIPSNKKKLDSFVKNGKNPKIILNGLIILI